LYVFTCILTSCKAFLEILRNNLMEFLKANKVRHRDRGIRLTLPAESVRRRALARLYERRSAVENLISSLERYQQEQRQVRTQRSNATAAEMSS
jgi:hypothetical protein